MAYYDGSKSYDIGDDSSKLALDFPIDQLDVTVTEDMIFIKHFQLRIKLTLHENGSTFDFYQKLYPDALRDFSVSIDVHICSFTDRVIHNSISLVWFTSKNFLCQACFKQAKYVIMYRS